MIKREKLILIFQFIAMTVLLAVLILGRYYFNDDVVLGSSLIIIFSLLLKPYREQVNRIFVFNEWYSTYLALYQKDKIKKTEKVRVSFDRLYRVKSKGNYLLYFNEKYKKYMALGSLHVYSNKTKNELDKINAIQDNYVKGHEFKFSVPAKNLGRLVKIITKSFPRYKANHFILKDFLNSCESKQIKIRKSNVRNIEFQGRIESNLEFSRVYQQYEMKFYDIYNVKIDLNGIELINKDNKFIWTTEKKIYSNGSDPENNIYSENIHKNVYRILEQECKNYIKF